MRLLVTAILLLTAAFPCLAQPGWVAQTSPVAGNLDAVDFVTPQVGWICGEGGVILHTTDGGDHWIEQQSGTSRHLMGISFADSQVGVAAGEDQIVLRTTDGGASWETVRAPAQDVFPFRGVHASDAQHMWLPTEVEEPDFGAAFVSWSTNGGAGWNDREVACTDLPHTCTNAFSAIFAVDSQLIFAAGTRLTWDGLLFGVIYRTADGGASWDEFANWYGVACTDVQFVSPTVGFAECGGLAKTWDGGAGWIWRDDGGPASRRAFLDGTRGWVCGAAGYVASTTDGGNSWAVQNSGTSADLRGIDRPHGVFRNQVRSRRLCAFLRDPR